MNCLQAKICRLTSTHLNVMLPLASMLLNHTPFISHLHTKDNELNLAFFPFLQDVCLVMSVAGNVIWK